VLTSQGATQAQWPALAKADHVQQRKQSPGEVRFVFILAGGFWRAGVVKGENWSVVLQLL
jgi:hypothetical protein